MSYIQIFMKRSRRAGNQHLSSKKLQARVLLIPDIISASI